EPVESVALVTGSQQRLLGVLAVDLDRPAAQFGHVSRCAEAAVDVGSRPPRGRHDPSEHPLRAVAARAVAIGTVGEQALDHRGVGPRSNPRGIGSRTAEQAESLDHHGLARAGLARERGQTGGKGDPGLGDHPEVPDGEFDEHDGPERRGPPLSDRAGPFRASQRGPSWNFSRSTAWKSRSPKVTRRAGWSLARHRTVEPGSSRANGRPSTDTPAARSPPMVTRTSQSGRSTIERSNSMWAATGAMRTARWRGSTIGPRTENT